MKKKSQKAINKPNLEDKLSKLELNISDILTEISSQNADI